VLAIVLALGSSACYGVSNFLGPQLARRYTLISALLLSQTAALIACALYVIFGASRSFPASGMWLALLAGIGNAGGLIGFYKAAELGPLSVVAPIGAVGAVIPVVWGLTSGGESLKLTQAVGLVFALGGAVLAARGTPPIPEQVLDDPILTGSSTPRDGELSAGVALAVAHAAHSTAATVSEPARLADAVGPELRHPEPRHQDPRASALWASASAVAFGVFLTALPKAAAHGRAWALFDARLVMVMLIILWAGRGLRTIKLERGIAILAVPGLLLLTGTLLYTAAAARGELSLVSVLGSLFPIFTVGLGVALLHERLSRTQTVGVLAALGGVVLIAL
jgi:drug/metabolite transporter (DMT)-like permease